MTTPLTVEPPESRRLLDRLVGQPFYEDDRTTIYHADCRQVLPFLGCVDLALTDPPYGIDFDGKKIGTDAACKVTYDGYEDTAENYTQKIVPVLWQLIERSRTVAVFAPSIGLSFVPPPRDVGGVFSDSCRGLSAFGFSCFHPVALYGEDVKRQGRVGGSWPTGFVHRGKVTVHKGHPCAKPVEWLRWFVGRLSNEGDMIVDPFMGSGTTLVAAKIEGRRAIGMDISERYCEIAAERLRQGSLF